MNRFLPSLAAILLLASPAWSLPKKKDIPKPKDRAEYLSLTQAGVTKVCNEINSWKVLKFDPETGARQTGGAVNTDLAEGDKSTGDLPPGDKSVMRARVAQARSQCVTIQNKDKGLPALAAADASLDKISAGQWAALTEPLDALLIRYQGYNPRGETSTSNYLDGVLMEEQKKGKTVTTVMTPPNAKNDLAEAAVQSFLAVLDSDSSEPKPGDLSRAIKSARAK